jgi:hypothetical protein
MIRDITPGSRIQILIFYPSRISDPGVKMAPDPGSATLQNRVRQFIYGIYFSLPFLLLLDPGCKKSRSWIRDGKIRIKDKHPGSSALQLSQTF